jgi:menaquinone-dependent protoporphyrinogen oxidase
MRHVLIVFSSTDGHTIKICERLKRGLEDDGQRVTLRRLDDSLDLDLQAFDTIVIGASIRYGKHRKSVYDFIARNLPQLEAKPSAFFSVNIVARKAEKSRPENNPYLLRFLCEIAWRPRAVAVFAGKLDYPSYGVCDRLMIRLIMKITHGPTDPATVIEYTDWSAVDVFAHRIGRL